MTHPEDITRSFDFEHSEKVRSLDALEEVFWLLEQRFPMAAVLAAELEGETSVQMWEAAMLSLQTRYPFLSLRISKASGERPCFVRSTEPGIAFRVVPFSDAPAIVAEMERALRMSFEDGRGPLVRVTVFHSPLRCAVVLSAHHAATDGKTNLMVLLDLLAAVAGEELGPPVEVSPTLSDLFGLPAAGAYTKGLEPLRDTSYAVAEDRREHLHVKRVQLSREETAALVRCAHVQGATVQGALVAALVVAGRAHREAWRTAPVRYRTAIDLRSMFSIPDAPGLLISVHASSIAAAPDRSVWELARSVSDEVRGAQARDAALASIVRLRHLVDVEHDPTAFLAAGVHRAAHELMVTNYGKDAVTRTRFGPLRLNALSTGSASGVAETQKVSAITVDGKMMLTLVSPAPFPWLLDDARELLAQACLG
jgi:hypothetical protein